MRLPSRYDVEPGDNRRTGEADGVGQAHSEGSSGHLPIWLVDDESDALLLKTMLNGWDTYDVECLLSPRQAMFELTLGYRKRPSVIIVELNLWGHSGYRFIAQLRRHPNFALRSIPLVVISEEFSDRAYAWLAKHGVARILKKPLSAIALVQSIDHALSGANVEDRNSLRSHMESGTLAIDPDIFQPTLVEQLLMMIFAWIAENERSNKFKKKRRFNLYA